MAEIMKRPARVRQFTCLIFYFVFAGNSSPLGAVEFEIFGLLKREPLALRGKTFNYQMTVAVSGCNWSISKTSVDRIGPTFWLSTDGANIYKYIDYQNVLRNTADERASRAINHAMGEIHSSGFPINVLEPEIMVLYYSYASQCYLANNQTDSVYPIKNNPNDLDHPSRKVLVKVSESAGDFSSSRQLLFYTIDPKGQTITNGLMTASKPAITTQGNIFTHVEYLEYFSGAKQMAICRYSFDASNVLLQTPKAHFVPTPAEKTRFYDYRFSPSQYAVVAVRHTNLLSHWPSEAASRQLPTYSNIVNTDWKKFQADVRVHEREAALGSNRNNFRIAQIIVCSGLSCSLLFLLRTVYNKLKSHATQ
jgi:hypothetical protein